MPRYNPGRTPVYSNDLSDWARKLTFQLNQEFATIAKLLSGDIETSFTVFSGAGGGSGGGGGGSTSHDILSSTHTDTDLASKVRGDLLYVSSTLKWGRLALGASGTYPRSNGTDLVYSSLIWGDLTGTLSDQTDLQDELDMNFALAIAL